MAAAVATAIVLSTLRSAGVTALAFAGIDAASLVLYLLSIATFAIGGA